jgi:hypothetical protein
MNKQDQIPHQQDLVVPHQQNLVPHQQNLVPHQQNLVPHQHYWIDVTTHGDKFRTWKCTSCPATKREHDWRTILAMQGAQE